MDTLRVGRSIRALRIHRGWRQVDLAEVSGVSRSVISRIERGFVAATNLASIERICIALRADVDVRIRWQGDRLDRLLDEVHANIVDRFVRQLRDADWDVAVEVTFNEYGERGAIDALGWHAPTQSLLVGEIKSVVADAQGTFAAFDRKARLGPQIARSRGWNAVTVSRVLVIRDGSTNRRRVEHLADTFDVALPDRGSAFRRWLRAPSRSVSALVFLPDSPQKTARRRPSSWQRVMSPKSNPSVSQ